MADKEVSHEEAVAAQDDKPKKKKEPTYKSQEGFIEVPVLRGLTEIENLYYNVISPLEITIMGGYVRYMCSPAKNPAPASDIDLYTKEEQIFENLIAALSDEKLEIKSENDVSVTYKPIKHGHWMFPSPRIQVVKPMAEGVIITKGNIEEILDNFDFTVVRIALLNIHFALADADFLHDEEKKLLRIKNIHCPISTMYRVMKYNRKGYWPPTNLIVKVFQDWDNRDDEYRLKVFDFFKKAEGDEELTQEEIDELESMMRFID